MKTRVKRFFKPPFTLELAATNAIWLKFEVDGDEGDITIGMGFFIGFYLSMSIQWDKFPWPTYPSSSYPGKRFRTDRDTSLYIWVSPDFWDTSLSIYFWYCDDLRHTNEWSGLSWYGEIGRLRGKHDCEWEEVGQKSFDFHAPEGYYPVVVVRKNRTDRWRFWFTKRSVKFEVIPETPIPVPGRGTAAHNCGEDAVHSMYMGMAKSYDEAMEMFVESIKETRSKYGGEDWVPSNSNEK